MIQIVHERAKKAKYLDRLIIATDDERIYQSAKDFGAEVKMTSPNHNSGTDRTAEVSKQINTPIIINIQGDEPLLEGEMIDALIESLQDEAIPMATLITKVKDLDLLHDINIVKVIQDKEGFALYFSRSPLPFKSPDYFLQHIGIYGYQKDFLMKFNELPPSRLERIENLEQLRALEYGYKIKVIETPFPTLSVDTPQDIIKVENYLKKSKND